LYYYRGYVVHPNGIVYSPDATFSTSGSTTYNQIDYKFFSNKNGLDVMNSLSSQNTAVTLNNSNDSFRLRMLMNVSGSGSLAVGGQKFKLQYAPKVGTCDAGFAGENYSDITKDTPIAFYKNPSANDKIGFVSNAADPIHSTDTIVSQSYVESNIFTNSIAPVPAGQDAKWDFSLYDKGVSSGATYCIRMVFLDGRLLSSYSAIPEITTATYKSRGGGIGGNIESVATPNAPAVGGNNGGGQGTYFTQCNDGVDNNNNQLIDTADPNCHAGGTLQGQYDPAHDSESVPPSTPSSGGLGGGGGGGGNGDLGYWIDKMNSIFNFSSFKDYMLGSVINAFK